MPKDKALQLKLFCNHCVAMCFARQIKMFKRGEVKQEWETFIEQAQEYVHEQLFLSLGITDQLTKDYASMYAKGFASDILIRAGLKENPYKTGR